MKNLELTALNCTNCGASVTNYEGKDNVNCEYCNTQIKILRPRHVKVPTGNLTRDNFDKLSNYIEILQKAIRAGNYSEGYEYCNKALEINPNIGSIWENKAICAFWRSVSFLNEDKITNTNAREIRTFLNASIENDPESNSYEITADAIGANLFTLLKLKFNAIDKDTTIKIGNKETLTFSDRSIIRSKDILETMQTSYDIMVNKDINILKFLVKEFTNNGKMMWWEPKSIIGKPEYPGNTKPSKIAIKSGLNVGVKLNGIIKQIKNVESNYSIPEVKLQVVKLWQIIVLVASFIILYFSFSL
jgi:DNA-directed RNA polymerase subunit RPC12/RpoP